MNQSISGSINPHRKKEAYINFCLKRIKDVADGCVSIAHEFQTEFLFTNALKALIRERRLGIGRLI
jgi:hypothetical protein